MLTNRCANVFPKFASFLASLSPYTFLSGNESNENANFSGKLTLLVFFSTG